MRASTDSIKLRESGSVLLSKFDPSIPPANAMFLVQTYLKLGTDKDITEKFHELFEIQAKQDSGCFQQYYDFYMNFFNTRKTNIVLLQKKSDLPDLKQQFKDAIESERRLILAEMMAAFSEVDETIEKLLIPNNPNQTTQVILYQLFTDASHTLYPYFSDVRKRKLNQRIQDTYALAIQIASTIYVHAHPIYLSLVINYAVFRRDILDNHDDPLYDISRAYVEIKDTINELAPDLHQKTVRLMEVMQHNMVLWTPEERNPPKEKKKTRESRKLSRNNSLDLFA